jgi:NTP pyrophosphatase (non-canonical NTP hydrolase)
MKTFKEVLDETKGLSIQLKNIDLSNVSDLQQCIKINEEQDEFSKAFSDYIRNKSKENKSHVIEEFWDVVQVLLGLMDKNGISSIDTMKEYHKHLEKIKNRPR